MINLPNLPVEGGSYTLYFTLDALVRLPIKTLNEPSLFPGKYVYVGSAYGPGGLRARISRHLKAKKRIWWHIDYLSTVVSCNKVMTFPGGRECDLIASFLSRGSTVPINGFGSSDCERCPAHLVCLAPN